MQLNKLLANIEIMKRGIEGYTEHVFKMAGVSFNRCYDDIDEICYYANPNNKHIAMEVASIYAKLDNLREQIEYYNLPIKCEGYLIQDLQSYGRWTINNEVPLHCGSFIEVQFNKYWIKMQVESTGGRYYCFNGYVDFENVNLNLIDFEPIVSRKDNYSDTLYILLSDVEKAKFKVRKREEGSSMH